MTTPLPPFLREEAARLAYRNRVAAETALFQRPSGAERFRLLALEAAGAIALGILSAGLSIFAIVIVLNVIFHYAPGP